MAINADDAVWVDVLPSMRGFGPALAKGTEKEADKVGTATGKRFGTALLAGTAVVAGGAALATKALFGIGETFYNLENQISVSTGKSGDALDVLVDAAKRVGQQVPASFEDVGKAVATVESNFGFAELTADEFDRATVNAINFSKGFEVELDRVTQVAGQLLKTGLVKDADEAFDLLTAASQKVPTALREDLLDAVDEYGPFFAQIGISGEEAMSALVNASEKGMYGIDKTGDALKEFTIRATDMSAASKVGFDALGLSQEDMTAKLLAGGETGAAAFQQIVAGLQSIKDPVAQSQAALALFGTPLEDLGTENIPTFIDSLVNAENTLGDVEGAAGRMGDTLNGGLKDEFQRLRNELSVLFAPAAEKVFGVLTGGMQFLRERAVPALKEFGGWLDRNSGALKVVGTAIGIVVLGVGTYIATVKVVTAVTKGWAAVQAVLNGTLLLNPIGIVVAALVALGAGLVLAYQKSETFRNVVQRAWKGIQDAASFAWERVLKPVFTALGGFITGTLVPTVMGFWLNTVRPAFQAIGAFVKTVWSSVVQPALAALRNFIRDVVGPVVTWLWKNVVQPAFNGIGIIIKAGWQANKLIFDILVYFFRNVLGPVFTWLWKNIVKPAFDGIAFVVKVGWNVAKLVLDGLILFFRNVLAPIFTWLWKNVVKPAFDGISSAIKWAWNNVIRPVFDALGGFIERTVAPAFNRGVDAIGRAWDRIKSLARVPVNFVIDTVYNNGIRAAFNKVAEVFKSDARLPRANIVARAKGGWTRSGMVLVGEEGPELVDFKTPGRVYTAAQTRAMEQKERERTGNHIGGPLDSIVSGVKRAVSTVTTALSDPTAFVKTQIDRLMSAFPASGKFGDIIRKVPGRLLELVKTKVESFFGGFFDGGGTFSGGTGKWRRPGIGRVTSEFGMRRNPVSGIYKLHNGIDVAAGTGSPIYAASDGRVLQAGRVASYGNFTRIDHGAGTVTGYAHQSALGVRPGQLVRAGQLIGREGTTGNSTGPHLHFNVQRGGRFVNPRTLPIKFDTGGYVPPGVHQIANLTRKPEMMLNPQMSSWLEQAASGKATGYPEVLEVRDVDGVLMGVMEVAGARALAAQDRAQRMYQ